MQWFNGTITEAILTSRQTKSMFVVVVTSDDDESRQLLEKLEQEKLSTLFKKFVCISLKQGTSEADQFNQFCKNTFYLCVKESRIKFTNTFF